MESTYLSIYREDHVNGGIEYLPREINTQMCNLWQNLFRNRPYSSSVKSDAGKSLIH